MHSLIFPRDFEFGHQLMGKMTVEMGIVGVRGLGWQHYPMLDNIPSTENSLNDSKQGYEHVFPLES